MTSFARLASTALAAPALIMTSLSLWRHSNYDVIRYWAGHAQRYGRTYVRTGTYVRAPYRV